MQRGPRIAPRTHIRRPRVLLGKAPELDKAPIAGGIGLQLRPGCFLVKRS